MASAGFNEAFVVAGEFNAVPPAPSSGQRVPFQVDTAGNLLVNVTAGGGGGVQYADGTTQATPTGTVALGKNPSNILHALGLSASGNLNVNLAEGTISGGNAAAGLTGAAVPTSADYEGVNIGGNLVGVTGLALGATTKAPTVAIVDGSGNQITSFGGGTQFADNAASGATPTGTLSMGWDSANSKVRALKVDASQDLLVAFPSAQAVTLASTTITGTVTVSLASTTITGTVAVTQSTTPWTIQGDSASGAAKAGNPVQIGGVFNTTQPTVTTGQTVEAQSTARGAQIVATGVDAFAVNCTQTTSPWVVSLTSTTITGTVAVTQSTTPWVDNLTQVASTVLGTPQTFGTAPTGVVIGTSSDIYAAGTRVRSNQTTTAAGVVDVNIAGVLGVTNSVTNGLFISITDGTTKAGVIVATTALKTDMSSVAGTATVTAAAGVQKVGIVGNANATVDSTAAAGTAPTNALLDSAVFNTTIPAPTAGQAVAKQCDSTGSLSVNTEGRKATYRMAVRGFTPVASATSPIFSIQGSATKTVRITHIKVSWSCSTGTALPNDISLQKFSALTGGTTGNTPTGAKNDTNNAAQTAVCLQYSAVPTTATVIGGISAVERMTWITAGATTQITPPVELAFGNLNGQELVLRGTAEFYGIVLAAIGTTPVMSIWIEWTEE